MKGNMSMVAESKATLKPMSIYQNNYLINGNKNVMRGGFAGSFIRRVQGDRLLDHPNTTRKRCCSGLDLGSQEEIVDCTMFVQSESKAPCRMINLTLSDIPSGCGSVFCN